jgi:lipid-A-disaccharide synthase-like uncharacterized protein
MVPKKFFAPPVILLVLLLLLVFAVPFFPKSLTPTLYQVLFTAVILAAAFSLKERRRFTIILAIAIISIKWIILFYDSELRNISNIPSVIFFIWIVGRLLFRIAYAPRNTSLVIVDCINGYFLMALVSAIFIGLTNHFAPHSFNFSAESEVPIQGMNDYIYHALVVFSTTGFGDIVPITPQAKAISNFISVSGQLYVAIIITLLIGNYSSQLRNADATKKNKETV